MDLGQHHRKTSKRVQETFYKDDTPPRASSKPSSLIMSDNNKSIFSCMNSIRMVVLVVLCLQNSLFTVIRRYSLGTRQEKYSKYEVLLVSEIMKMIFSAYMIVKSEDTITTTGKHRTMQQRLGYLISTSQKMIGLALIYGAMNTLSLISLKNIGAGMFTIFAQCKILTTAACSSLILRRQYSWTQWRALIALSLGVLLFSQPIWDKNDTSTELDTDANVLLGTAAVLIEVTLSGFSSIYFEKVIKTDPLQLSIWERNFQLAFGSVPVYLAFMAFTTSPAEIGAGWTPLAWGVASLGAAGGLLVALSIKYGDSILKTLATTGAIILSSVLDHVWLGGPLTPAMMIAAGQVVISICNYTFDTTPAASPPVVSKSENGTSQLSEDDEEMALINEKK
ncbi:hypothetical protein FisN_9Lh165 [Fistulifera solaris]|uniref:Solute carrier family 35 (UDP-sugar transporter), member A1/2/3 n=1 Tax=Fistulifera solaris TaxID=1519565 RepID=A0A1Z5KKS8_FISSO|nr:hypothetical protein FisN_9Lh165 [Fistulifera solaris]|eukprot:GAX26876.1 hypothetical protein FisN_9Lh165 [Fistulifera solaris]